MSRQIELEKRKRKEVAEVADKKARELQALNAQLVSQLRDGESQLQQKSNDLKRMKNEQ